MQLLTAVHDFMLRQFIDECDDFAVLFTLWKKKNLFLRLVSLSANIFALTV